jgi:hypothetical protein
MFLSVISFLVTSFMWKCRYLDLPQFNLVSILQ